jgi:hypothetical protein
LFPATTIQAHLVPFSKGQMANPSPLGASFKKLLLLFKLFIHFCILKDIQYLQYYTVLGILALIGMDILFSQSRLVRLPSAAGGVGLGAF